VVATFVSTSRAAIMVYELMLTSNSAIPSEAVAGQQDYGLELFIDCIGRDLPYSAGGAPE
jgi:hypothetical protein